jgi:hypothetical protein
MEPPHEGDAAAMQRYRVDPPERPGAVESLFEDPRYLAAKLRRSDRRIERRLDDVALRPSPRAAA